MTSQPQQFTIPSRGERLRGYDPSHPDFDITLTLTAGPGLVDQITTSAAERAATKALVIEGLSGGKGLYVNTVEVG